MKYGRRYQKGLNVTTTVAMAAFHLGAVLALFYVNVGAILAAAILYCVAGMLGIGMAYHRLLTHRGYKTYKGVEYFLTWCGTLRSKADRSSGLPRIASTTSTPIAKAIRTLRVRARGGRMPDGS